MYIIYIYVSIVLLSSKYMKYYLIELCNEIMDMIRGIDDIRT